MSGLMCNQPQLSRQGHVVVIGEPEARTELYRLTYFSETMAHLVHRHLSEDLPGMGVWLEHPMLRAEARVINGFKGMERDCWRFLQRAMEQSQYPVGRTFLMLYLHHIKDRLPREESQIILALIAYAIDPTSDEWLDILLGSPGEIIDIPASALRATRPDTTLICGAIAPSKP